MSDKRSVNTDALQTLGTIITDGGRDAIHLAVEPVVAGETLYPGQDIGLLNGNAISTGTKLVGIVDPFLKNDVQKGEMFWLIVYPRQITSLRHVWSHPDFEEAVLPNEVFDEVAISKNWVSNFAQGVGLEYSTVMDGASDWVRSHDGKWGGEYLCFGGLLEGESVPDEFWSHYEIITGTTVEENKRGSFFTCSC